MINLKCRSEYSFRAAYGKVEEVLACGGYGLCDRNGTWGHVQFNKIARKKKIKPVFGVELAVVFDASNKIKQPVNWMSFIAASNKGLQEIYELTTLATKQSYYHPRISYQQLYDLSEEVIILSGVLPQWGFLPRSKNVYIELSPMSSEYSLKFAREKNYKILACNDNFYPRAEDRKIYEVIAASNRDDRTKPMHILDQYGWKDCLTFAPDEAVRNTHELYESCNAELPKAEMVHFASDKTLKQLCLEGATRRGIDLSNPAYSERLEYELELIKKKNFEDYFYVILTNCKPGMLN